MSAKEPTGVTFFASPEEARAWFQTNHKSADELWVGFYKKGSGRGGAGYQDALDQALCFGWIDGITRSLDDDSYTVRFTPRRAKSNWSNVNIRRFGELQALGLIQPAGQAAFDAWDKSRPPSYSFEQERPGLSAEYEDLFRREGPAWAFFEAQPPGYRRTAGWWVMSARREETRLRRLQQLIEASARGERLSVVTGEA